MPEPPVLLLRNATVIRGQAKVFDRLSLEVPAERNVAILGPNGAGKSTLLQLVTRDLYPTYDVDSRIEVLGRVRWNVADLRHLLGVVSHELQVRHQREIRGVDVVRSGFFGSIGIHAHQTLDESELARVEESLERLKIKPLRDRMFNAMSAGEQRRFLLARALVGDPRTLLLDEPTTSLDLRAAFELLTLLRELAREGRRLVLVTHRVEEIPPEVSWILLLKEGELVAAGEKQDVLRPEALSDVFEVPLRVVEREGFYALLPGPEMSAISRASSVSAGSVRQARTP